MTLVRNQRIGKLIRTVHLVVRLYQFICSFIILGAFSYFIVIGLERHSHISTRIRAIHGLSFAGAIYSLLLSIFGPYLGDFGKVTMISLALDGAFVPIYLSIALLNRSCGRRRLQRKGRASDSLPDFRTACGVRKGCFVLALLTMFSFFVSFFCLYVQPDYDVGQDGFLRDTGQNPVPSRSPPRGGLLKRFFRWRKKPEDTAELDYVNKHNMQPGGHEGYYNNRYHLQHSNPVGISTPGPRPVPDPFGTPGMEFNSYGKSSSQGIWDGNI